MVQLLRDLRYGARALLRRRGFSTVVALTLGLAIGANTTIFSLVNVVLLRPLPFAAPHEIAFLRFNNPEGGEARAGVSYPDYLDLRAQLSAFEDLAASATTTFNLTGEGEPARLGAQLVSANYFRLLGVGLERGRGFSSEEDRPGGPQVAILSHGAWTRRFGADPGIVGREITLDGEPRTVVAVLSAQLEYGRFRAVEVWAPLRLDANREARDRRWLTVAGRLRPDHSLEQAGAEVATAARRLAAQYPASNRGWNAQVSSLTDEILAGNGRLVLVLLAVAVTGVLFIACANVANLVMARSLARSREVALRTALGAGRAGLVQQLLVEGALLAVVGGVLGLAVAWIATRLLVVVTRGQDAFFREVRIDGNVLLFTLLLALITPLLFALLPALRVSGGDVASSLKAHGADLGGEAGRWRRLLTAAQVALALVLLIVCGLAARSVKALGDLEPGFETGDLLSLRLDLPPARYGNPATIRAFADRALAEVAAVPGVRAAAFTSHRPIEGGEPRRSFEVVGRARAESGELPWAATVIVSPELFSVLQVPLLSGRPPRASDNETSAGVAVISQVAAERYWGAGDPIGSEIELLAEGSRPRRLSVVGVVADLRNPDASEPPEPYLYLPLAQSPTPGLFLLARTATAPLSALGAVREALWRVDADQPIDDARTMQQVLWDDLSTSYALAGLMSYFALVALALATAGIYGVLSYSVSQRAREIGVRMALGARISDVVHRVLLDGLTPVFAGAGIGLLAALGASRFLESLVWGISSTDPLTYFGVLGGLLVLAVIASAVPALRAARTDPSTVLRQD